MYIIISASYSIDGNASGNPEKIDNIQVESEKGLSSWRVYKQKEYAKKIGVEVDRVECTLTFVKK